MDNEHADLTRYQTVGSSLGEGGLEHFTSH